MRSYEYKIGFIKRSCGHEENAGNISSSIAHEPTVQKWELEKDCRDCIKKEYARRSERIAVQQAIGEKYAKDHGLENAVIQADEKHCEITVYL